MFSSAIIAFYGRTLQVILRHQFFTLMVAAGTLAGTVILFLLIPKGFFPVQDTGVILGVSEAAQTVSFPAMAKAQQELAKIILKDPAVDSLSSFIGVDGTNTTINSGRIQINLKPIEERRISASDIIRRLQPELARSRGNHALHAAGAGSDGGRSGEPDAVSVQPGRSRCARNWRPGCRDSSRNCKRFRCCATWRAISRTEGCRRCW